MFIRAASNDALRARTQENYSRSAPDMGYSHAPRMDSSYGGSVIGITRRSKVETFSTQCNRDYMNT